MRAEREGKRPGQNDQWLCMKWPSNGASVGCKLELPWVFKTLKNVGALAVEQIQLIHKQRPELVSQASSGLRRVAQAPLRGVSGNHPDITASISKSENRNGSIFFEGFLPQVREIIVNMGKWRKDTAEVSVSQDDLGELEERALAQALARRKPATIIEFYSPRCTLCKSLVPVVAEVESKHEEWLHILMVDVENKRWLPEVLQYDIKYVPCFLLLDSYGNALAKTGVPYSRTHVLQGLAYLLESMQPIRNRVRYLRPANSNSRTP